MSKQLKSVAELYAEYESQREQGKLLYEKADVTLAKLVSIWKKDKLAIAREEKNKTTGQVTLYRLEIEAGFRGEVKVFAPAYAHRYKLKTKAVE